MDALDFLIPAAAAAVGAAAATLWRRRRLPPKALDPDFYRRFFHHNPTWFHSLDADGRYLEVNDAELAALGYRREEMIGRTVAEFMTPASAEVLRSRWPAFKERGHGAHDYQFRRKDGRTLDVRIHAVARRDADGRFLYTYTTAIDVTEHLALLREVQAHARRLETLNDALDQATRFKSQFLANQAHELRTPINAVVGFAELLRDEIFGGLNEKQKEYVAEILAGGRHLTTLINNVMDLSRIEAGGLTLSPACVDLVIPLSEAMALLKPDAQRRRIALRAVAIPGVTEVYADADRLRQIFVNLLSNAVRFTPDGGTVEVQTQPEAEWVHVRVRDTGIGIALADQARIFQPFQQAALALDASRRGTGLGLAIAKTLVELHGGSLSLQSEPGKGSTFTVRLPAHRNVYEAHRLRTPAPAAATRT
jgi:PAS domain S-box-containing protein